MESIVAVWSRTRQHRQLLMAGVAGQFLNLLAMIGPVLLSTHVALVNIVVVSTLSSSCVAAAILAFPMTYPSIEDERIASAALKASFGFLLAVCLLLGILGAVLVVTIPRAGSILLGVSALLVFQGYDRIFVGWLVRRGNASAIGQNRLRYGISNFLITSIVAEVWEWNWSLVVAACAVNAVTVLWVGSSFWAEVVPDLRAALAANRRMCWEFMKSNVWSSMSYVVTGFGTQAQAFAVVSLGALAPAWAVIVRLCGGFYTLNLQLFAPSFDAKISRYVRSRELGPVRRSVALGVGLSALLAVGALLVSTLVAVVSGYLQGVGEQGFLLVCGCGILWYGTGLATGTVANTLALIGAGRARLAWSVVQFVALLGVLLATDGQQRLLLSSITIAAMNLSYLALIATATARRPMHRRTKRSVLPTWH